LNPKTVTCGGVTLFGAGAGLAGGRAASSRRGGWPEPSGVELLGGLAIVADVLASAWLSGPAFAAMAIPARNAVPIPMDLPIVDISYLSRFYPHGGEKRKKSTVRSISFYQHYYQQQLRMSRNYNELLLDKNTDDEVPLCSVFQL
jgi:hypothetical protein